MKNNNSNCHNYDRVPVVLYVGSTWWSVAWHVIRYFCFPLFYLFLTVFFKMSATALDAVF